jgi:N-acetylneuraminic acid mutarotase
MGKKDKKKDAASKEARAAKQSKKLEKGSGKGAKDTGDDDDQDIDAILEEFRSREEAKTSVRVSVVNQPSPRANFSLTSLPNGDMLMFGGEFCDGTSTTVYNDVLRWNVEKNEWKQIESLNTPPPRCSHQAVYFNDKLYIFGGEYATLDQFHHYRDLWSFDPKTQTWTEIHPTGDLPSARSGHRMCVWRGYMVLFGGFYEQKRDMNWYNDTYIYSFQEEKWNQVHYKPLAHTPRVRSGHQMVVYTVDDCIYMYGGFSKEKMALQDATRKEAHIHDDMWMLDLKPVLGLNKEKDKKDKAKDNIFDADKAIWSKLSKKGINPSIRCGSVMTNYKINKILLFGGVYDEDSGHGLKSVFHSDLFSFDMSTRRWFNLAINSSSSSSSRSTKVSAEKVSSTSKDEEDDEEEEDDDDISSNNNNNENNDNDNTAISLSTVLTKLAETSLEINSMNLSEIGSVGKYFNKHYSTTPCPRINPATFIKGNKLYIYGGVTELEDVEVTLDDCWYIDINKKNKDGWMKVLDGTMDTFVWKGILDNATEGTLSDDEGEDEGDIDGDVTMGRRRDMFDENDDNDDNGNNKTGEKEENVAIAEKVPSTEPTEGEALRDFYNRTSDHWLALAEEKADPISDDATDKEKTKWKKAIKTNAFSLAEVHFNDSTA